jgi:TonB family protein
MSPRTSKALAVCAFAGSALVLDAADARLVAPRVIEEPEWHYPLEAERDAVSEGQARAILSIDETGRLTDFLVVDCSHPAFGTSLAEALPAYRFTPARVRNEPTPTRMPVTFYFQQRGAVISMTGFESMERRVAGLLQRNSDVSFLCSPAELDRPLTAVKVVAPGYPEELRARGASGEVTIDFFVDGEGRVRLPAADYTANPSFGRVATDALLLWKFEPPTRRGEPVIVHVLQTFRFVPPPAEKGAARGRSE